MARDPQLPERVAGSGYYYHYKHEPDGEVNNYAYYIYGIGLHTEDDCRPEDQFTLVYRPLYESYVYKNGKMFDVRPLAMFYEPATIDGVSVPRFVKIEDSAIVEQLKAIQAQMYPEN